jgi:hypothetical protein
MASLQQPLALPAALPNRPPVWWTLLYVTRHYRPALSKHGSGMSEPSR